MKPERLFVMNPTWVPDKIQVIGTYLQETICAAKEPPDDPYHEACFIQHGKRPDLWSAKIDAILEKFPINRAWNAKEFLDFFTNSLWFEKASMNRRWFLVDPMAPGTDAIMSADSSPSMIGVRMAVMTYSMYPNDYPYQPAEVMDALSSIPFCLVNVVDENRPLEPISTIRLESMSLQSFLFWLWRHERDKSMNGVRRMNKTCKCLCGALHKLYSH